MVYIWLHAKRPLREFVLKGQRPEVMSGDGRTRILLEGQLDHEARGVLGRVKGDVRAASIVCSPTKASLVLKYNRPLNV